MTLLPSPVVIRSTSPIASSSVSTRPRVIARPFGPPKCTASIAAAVIFALSPAITFAPVPSETVIVSRPPPPTTRLLPVPSWIVSVPSGSNAPASFRCDSASVISWPVEFQWIEPLSPKTRLVPV